MNFQTKVYTELVDPVFWYQPIGFCKCKI